jgi:light-regulated signal transduction histidine kinase (bacteriophytochrome)
MITGISARKEKLEREITERKNAEREVRALNAELDERVKRRTASLNSANKELEAFAYSVSHDLRAPLRALDGFSLAVIEDYGDKLDDKGKDYLRRIRGGAAKMAELIDDILKLSRITRDEMRVEVVDLTLIAKSIADELKKQAPDRDVEFIIKDVNKISGDAKLLRVALENLIGNAFKFTRNTRGAKIEFGETKVGDETAIFVRDNGAGFDPSYKEMLFSPFHRLHTNAEFEGTGIGLATVKRVVIRHGGRIWGEGEIGNGATFYFII